MYEIDNFLDQFNKIKNINKPILNKFELDWICFVKKTLLITKTQENQLAIKLKKYRLKYPKEPIPAFEIIKQKIRRQEIELSSRYATGLQPSFSHIYVEKKVRDLPLTKLALSKFSDSNVIWVDHYKDVFNRSGQDFQSQKFSMNLILAKKTKPFLYPASDLVQNFDNPNIYYNTPVLNCIYNCDYCFLQGMYNSGNIVVFVNENEFRKSIKDALLVPKDPTKPTIVSISYNTDLLAMENILPLTRRWIEFAKKNINLNIEIRTKVR